MNHRTTWSMAVIGAMCAVYVPRRCGGAGIGCGQE